MDRLDDELRALETLSKAELRDRWLSSPVTPFRRSVPGCCGWRDRGTGGLTLS